MLRQIWKQSGPQELSENLRRVLIEQFYVNPSDLPNFRLLWKPGHFNRRRVKFIGIINMAQIESSRMESLNYRDLILADNHKAIKFIGWVEADGEIFLSKFSPNPSLRLAKLYNNQTEHLTFDYSAKAEGDSYGDP